MGELGYFEKAEAMLTELLKEDSSGVLIAFGSPSFTHLAMNIDGPIIQAELTRLRAAEKVREKEYNKRFKGMYILVR